MPTTNSTRNQHFISQAEQRLNALDPPANNRIYSFRLEDRENFGLRLEKPHGVSISSNLSFGDLFSFDVDGGEALRTNLELEFQPYEQNIGLRSRRLIASLAGPEPRPHLKEDLLEVFVAKFLNFFRNPYSVTKALNTLGPAADARLADASHQAMYERMLMGNKPQQSAVCRQFGLSEETYARWLHSLFLLVTRTAPGQPNFLELITKDIFESGYVLVHLFDYTSSPAETVCLLSDRGYSLPADSTGKYSFDFNLCSRAFINYTFIHVNAHIPPGTLPHIATAATAALRAQVNVTRVSDDPRFLKSYNRRVVYQCAERVFSASAVLPPLDDDAG